jgi:hypothetical protein
MHLSELNSHKVHKAIQGIDMALSNYYHVIPVCVIAENLHVNTEELSQHMDVLQNLYYIVFLDHSNEEICLTLTGRFTIIP